MTMQAMARPRGRPPGREDRERVLRNIEFGWLRFFGATIEEIARRKGYSQRTVIRGLQELATYPRTPLTRIPLALEPSEDDAAPDEV